MTSLRRTLLAGLWGVPGPVLAGIVISALIGLYPYDTFDLRAIKRAAAFWSIPLAEAILGLVYGLIRMFIYDDYQKVLTLPRGVIHGAFVCTAVALPILLIVATASLATVLAINEDMLILLAGISVAQVFGGAVAGFHVEYFLIRMRRLK